jgi:hypothetical protein
MATTMNGTWQLQAGHLSCRWSEFGQHLEYRSSWMQEASDVPSGYLPPGPDFASHSFFCGTFWFLPNRAFRDLE